MINEQIKAAKERREEIKNLLDDILSTAEERGDDLTPEEVKKYDALESEDHQIKEKIERLERQEQRLKDQAANAAKQAAKVAGGKSDEGEGREISKISMRDFRVTRAIQNLRNNKPLEGAEKEVFEEARNENPQLEGNVAIPSKFVQFQKRDQYKKFVENRDLTIGTEGADVRPTDFQPVIPILAASPIVVDLGARTFTGLSGNVQFPRHNGAASMAWEGETDAGAETTPTFDNLSMGPNRVGGFIDVSQTFIRQASFDAEAFVRGELERAYSLEFDRAAIEGSGSGNEPTGVLNTAGIGASDVGTNGGAPTWAVIKGNYENVETANAGMGSLGALMTPGVKYKLMETPKQSTGVEGNFILRSNDAELCGFRYASSTQVPSDLTKGTGSSLHAFIFGNWAELILGLWGGVDLLVDPYTQATSGLLRVVINAYADIGVRHAASFSASDDISVA